MQAKFDVRQTKTIYLVQEPLKEAFLSRLEGSYRITKDERRQLLVVFSARAKQLTYWEVAVLESIELVPVKSINHAATLLKKVQRDWSYFGSLFVRRSQLIQEKLRALKIPEKIAFFEQDGHLHDRSKVGYYYLLSKEMMLYAKSSSSPFLGFAPRFIENKTEPPSRAYLKLVEAFYRADKRPTSRDICLELGASPGSWTWVLAKLGAKKIFSFDRSELDPKINGMKGVHHSCSDAFSVTPESMEESVDWLLSDLICYPDKLYQYLQQWLDTPNRPNFICTLKFQGTEHYHWIDKFAEIKGSEIVHLFHNKHELTWINLRSSY